MYFIGIWNFFYRKTIPMTLHVAIEKLLKEKGHSMTTSEIADELNRNNWYQKKDGSAITPFQIHGRTRTYSQTFDRDGSTVSLKGQSKKMRLINILMNQDNFKIASSIDNIVPDESGFYCIRIVDLNHLPAPFNSLLEKRNHNIIYIGIASKSLYQRLLKEELRAKGQGTFFRSIGAVLGFRPEEGSLIPKENKYNYKFTSIDEVQIINWINDNLMINWVTYEGKFEEIETEVIERYFPLLNITKNPMALDELKELRAECRRIANKE